MKQKITTDGQYESLTPLCDFVLDFIKGDTARFFMPGHKGAHPSPVFKELSRLDITEIEGADSLYEADGVIAQSEEIAARLFEAESTCFSAGGSTLCIQAMLALTAKSGDTVIAARNAHIAFFNACALLDITPFWVMPDMRESFGVSGEITALQVEQAIAIAPNSKAVYITSPDYLGGMSDIKAIGLVCKRHNIPLLVDNAHGAHLKWLLEDCHPLKLGASLCCDSAHKTLPALTGAAYLHSARESGYSKTQMKEKMSMFGSTSPSYLILLSLDYCNYYLANFAKTDFLKLCKREEELWEQLLPLGFSPLCERRDPTKLTLDAYVVGKSGQALGEFFREYHIECEYAGERHVVLMLSPQNTPSDYEKLFGALLALNKDSLHHNLKPARDEAMRVKMPMAEISLREAMFAPRETVNVADCVGRISAATCIKCPPGVPIVAAGEIIDNIALKLLKKSSILFVDVIK